MWRAWLGAAIGLGCLACGDDVTFGDPPTGSGGSGGAGGVGGEAGAGGGPGDPPPLPEAPALAIAWTACSWYTGGQALDAECASIDVPLDWWDPTGPTIELYLKRGGALGDPTAQQLWFLMGGPGGASNGYESTGETFYQALPLQVYLLDHRGVGRSTRLGCSAEGGATPEGLTITPEEWPGCIDELVSTWGEGLEHFRTTQAAVDLGVLIDQTRAPEQDVHVHGGSYGTYWAQRYLQLFTDQATAVSMLGVVNPPAFSFARYDQQYEDVGGAFLEACANSATCQQKLGSDPAASMRAVYDALPGLCPQAGLTREELRTYAGSFLLWGWEERLLPLALAYRLNRCDPADVTAIQTFTSNLPPPIDGLLNDTLYSRVLGTHIGLSELWNPPIPSAAEADALVADALFAFGNVGRRIELDPLWPKYANVFYDDQWAETSIPLLMINGELDPASTHPEALGVGAHFTGPQQFFAAIPNGSHNWTSPTTEGFGCALNVFANFLVDPQGPLLDCMGEVLPLDFAGSTALASLMGTADIWENSATFAPIDPDPQALARAREALVRGAQHALR